MVEVKVKKGLDQALARMLVRNVDALAKDMEQRAKRNAPAVKEWRKQPDDRVRPEHIAVDGQKRPANLRFDLPSHAWDEGRGRSEKHQGDARTGPRTYFMEGGWFGTGRYYQENLNIAYVNAVDCRCYTTLDAQGLSRKIRRDKAVAVGTKVKAKVWIKAPFAIEAELGDVYPMNSAMADKVEPGTHFMRKAAVAAAAAARDSK